jgi:malyl-CoA/(S)-citramalyl-CoA lyase
VTLVTEVYPMVQILMAARAYGLRAIDGPCGAFRDGFHGKQVVHPRQIEITRDAFIPSDDEVAYAHRAIAALKEAERNGHRRRQDDRLRQHPDDPVFAEL